MMRWMNRGCAGAALMATMWATPVMGQTAGMLSFQGLIKDAKGDPVNGVVNLEFRIYDAETNGNLKAGPFGPTAVTATAGVVSTKFGPVLPVEFDGGQRWLAVSVDGSPLSRIEMAAAPAQAEQLNNPGTGAPVFVVDNHGDIHIQGLLHIATGNVGIGTENPGYGDSKFLTLFGASRPIIRIMRPAGIQPAAEFIIGMEDLDSKLRIVKGDGVSLPRDLTSGIIIDTTGFVGIGTAEPLTRLHVAGTTMTESLHVDGTTMTGILTITGGADLAEPFAVASSKSINAQAKPGHVVVIDPEHPGQLKLATEAYDAKVAGIISGANGLKPGLVMKAEGHEHADGEHNVALTGRVWCWCDATNGPIQPGDRLTTSATTGHAMRVTDNQRAIGAVIGKAMTPLAKGRGLVLVLVQPQ